MRKRKKFYYDIASRSRGTKPFNNLTDRDPKLSITNTKAEKTEKVTKEKGKKIDDPIDDFKDR